MSNELSEQYKKYIMAKVPLDGTSIGNTRLRNLFLKDHQAENVSEDKYWEVRNALVESGLLQRGRGQGGSVYRTIVEEVSLPQPQDVAAAVSVTEPVSVSELELYEPVFKSVSNGYIKEQSIDDHVIQITALQGRRLTGGKWTRPDIALVTVNSFDFVPGKHLEVITFEVKPSIATALEGVYECLAHSAFSNRAYLAVHITKDQAKNPGQEFERVSSECARHGVGLFSFTEPGNYDTFDLVQDSIRRTPDPIKVNSFITTQLSESHKDKIRRLLR